MRDRDLRLGVQAIARIGVSACFRREPVKAAMINTIQGRQLPLNDVMFYQLGKKTCTKRMKEETVWS
jgi:hypothetical protein